MPAFTTLSPAEVAARLAGSVGNLARELKGAEPTSRSGVEWRWGRKGSLGVLVAGPKQGWFHDNEAGKHGDALALVAHLRGCSMREAYRWALAWLGIEGRQEAADRPRPAAEAPKPPAGPDPAKIESALRLWWEAVPAMGSPVARYLACRGLALPPDDPFDDDPEDPRNGYPLRFHPTCPRGAERLPAMVALMSDPASGKPCGIHRTFLLPDGSGKAPGQAKMMLGAAGVIRLVPDAYLMDGLGIAEGIETSLAIMQRYGWAPVWAAGSAGGIGSFPVLPGIETLTIFPDADDSGASLRAAKQCAERWRAAGREVQQLAPPAGADFADLAAERAA